MGWGDILLLAITFGMLGLAVYLFVGEIAAENVRYQEFVVNVSSGVLNETKQFYPNMRFEMKEIGYLIDYQCSEANKMKIVEGLEEIDQRTLVAFYPSSNPDIIFECSSRAPSSEEKQNHAVAGAARPRFINASRFYVIQETNISLYLEESCDRPIVVIHETLHALGFDHINDPQDIMYPIADCEQEISSDTINEINRLYSITQGRDLVILNIKANTTRRHLDFNISVANFGLLDAQKVNLSILSQDNELLESFDLAEIGIGQTKILTVQNLRVSEGNIRFLVKDGNNPDLNPGDNYAVITAQPE